ncbi:DUF2589 domain-containing protein [Luteimonas abyssi]|uniref:DUF2589 domain-containing protein n=1 Tax=Luteimonas abyssi TaxID=1247514 RepID=UPI000737B862|nr:DUF2589 domain-containing protein [Luteimonas abyssi]
MATNTTLNSLIEALAGAVIEAQDKIEQHQTAHLADFFDEDNRPKSVVIRLPSLHPDATPGDEDLYRAPLLPLVSTNVLRIKDVEITFDADLGGLTTHEDEAPVPGAPPEHAWNRRDHGSRPRINVDTGAAVAGGQGSVHVVLRVEGSEPTDGAARLINHLAQTQGVFRTTTPKPSSGDGTPTV